jgi:hypothetical protein
LGQAMSLEIDVGRERFNAELVGFLTRELR